MAIVKEDFVDRFDKWKRYWDKVKVLVLVYEVQWKLKHSSRKWSSPYIS